MTDTTGAYGPELEQEIDQAIAARFGGGDQAVAAVDPKGVFCRNWPMVKQALEALAQFAPKYRWVIQIVITAGEVVNRRVCSEG